jgi:hypothetical protein
MPYRDSQGHFISEAEARSRGLIPPANAAGEVLPEVVEIPATATSPAQHLTWVNENQGEIIFIDTGRGQAVEAHVGENFEAAVNRAAEQVHYGGYFKVFLNGSEVVNPSEAPQTVQPGQRIAITAYDKVG